MCVHVHVCACACVCVCVCVCVCGCVCVCVCHYRGFTRTMVKSRACLICIHIASYATTLYLCAYMTLSTHTHTHTPHTHTHTHTTHTHTHTHTPHTHTHTHTPHTHTHTPHTHTHTHTHTHPSPINCMNSLVVLITKRRGKNARLTSHSHQPCCLGNTARPGCLREGGGRRGAVLEEHFTTQCLPYLESSH